MTRRGRLLPTLLLAAAALPAALSAQTVYRCGPEGNAYQQTPCPGGQTLNATDARSDVQRREAAQLSQREAVLTQALQHERQGTGSPPLQDDRAASAPQAARPRAPAPDGRLSARRQGRHRHPLGPDERMARTPKPPQPKKTQQPAQGDKPRP